jgi:hypothetical protein
MQKIIFALCVIITGYLIFRKVDKAKKDGFQNIPPTFENEIKPLFRKIDIESMKWKFDLTKYEDVKNNAQVIYDAVSTGYMPADAPWDKRKVFLFQHWMNTGMHP